MNELRVNRRHFLALSAGLSATCLLPEGAFADVATGTPLHGLSAFGELKYAPDFTHFDYVNPDAPKGGTFRFAPFNWIWNQNTQTFNTLNTFTFKGDAPPRMELTYDSLMVPALDEPDSLYGLLAESVELSKDKQSCLFRLRKQARFHDGAAVTARDVVSTYTVLKQKGHPLIRQSLAGVQKVEATKNGDVRMHFTPERGIFAILAALTLPILSARWLEEQDFEAATMEPVPGSGPYRVGKFAAGQFIEYERVADYWAKDLPVQRGANNFDIIRIEFYRDRQPEFEAFKKGDIDFRAESVAKNWATAYDFPAVAEKNIIKRTFPKEKRPLMQAWALNQRRERFRDPRVREAIALCFDFEWTNANLFYNAYERINSCFAGSDFEAKGLPTPDELTVLQRYRGRLPDAVFDQPVMMPVSDGSGRDRTQFSRAIELLQQAGLERKNGHFHLADGSRFTLELLSNSDSFTRIYNPFVQKMRAIGIDASLRLIDPSQYQARLRDFDFDMVGMAVQFNATPTEESLGSMFGSASANMPGSYNLPGTADPLIDELIADIGKATSRSDYVATMRVLDRYLRIRRDWLPNWRSANHLVAYWDRFGFREPKPDYGFSVETLWWIDENRAQAIGKS
ncbi:extracellular solute-binding protein [Daeguia caeni]|uniref:Extracellular solute-binding protein n=1 Tax=Daeguia caeni TaxID=439612 RepID=A0ABV9HB70_9HYPH